MVRSTMLLIAVVTFGGCVKEQQATDLDPAKVAVVFQDQRSDEKAALRKLTAWKARWLDADGALDTSSASRRQIACAGLQAMHTMHPDTLSGRSANDLLTSLKKSTALPSP
jgi:hypothetical protein